MGTNINAFIGAVSEAKENLAVAQSQLSRAVADLKDHPDYKPGMLADSTADQKKDTEKVPVRPASAKV